MFSGWLLWHVMRGSPWSNWTRTDSKFRVVQAHEKCGAEKCWHYGDRMRLVGWVSEPPVQSRSKWQVVIGDFVLYTAENYSLSRGDRVEFAGTLDRSVIVGGNRKYTLEHPDILTITKVGGSTRTFQARLLAGMLSVQRKIARVLVEYLPEPHGSLLVGIMLGVKEKMPDWFYNDLVNTGTLHVVAASGMNVTIVASFLIGIFGLFLPKRMAIVWGIVGIGGYTLIAGASAAVVRAAIMGILCYSAMFLGREYWASWGLVITAVLMVLFSPQVITQVGFWLSVAATGGILWLSGSVESGMKRIGNRLRVEEQVVKIQPMVLRKMMIMVWEMVKMDLNTTICAQLTTTPIIFAVFGRISVVSPLVNMMVLWLVLPIMLLGGIKVLALLFGHGVSYIGAMLVYVPLEFFVKLVSSWSVISQGGIEIELDGWKGGIMIIGMLAYYGGLVYWAIFQSRARQVTR